MPLGALPLAFTKMSGAGNDFIVFGKRVLLGPIEIDAIRMLCRRGTGIGADGVLFVHPESAGDPASRVIVDYVNADGSPARFCGNGTRCAARFAVRHEYARSECVLRTGWGSIQARVFPDGAVTLALPEDVREGRAVPSLDAPGTTLEPGAFAIEVGVPHVVAWVKPGVDLATLDLARLGPAIRHHPLLPEGANASFVEVLGPSSIAVRTWERGVEAETLACGAGSVASAIMTARLKGVVAPIAVATRSGQTLTIGFVPDGPWGRDVTLTGDARVVFEGELIPDEWKTTPTPAGAAGAGPSLANEGAARPVVPR